VKQEPRPARAENPLLSGRGEVNRRSRFSEHRRFIALRACWTILRGGSVAYRVNLTEDGDIQATAREFFAADVLVRGKPMTPWHIEYGQPERQPE